MSLWEKLLEYILNLSQYQVIVVTNTYLEDQLVKKDRMIVNVHALVRISNRRAWTRIMRDARLMQDVKSVTNNNKTAHNNNDIYFS